MRKAALLALEAYRRRRFLGGPFPLSSFSPSSSADPHLNAAGLTASGGDRSSHALSLSRSAFSFSFSPKPLFASRPFSTSHDPHGGATDTEAEDWGFEWEEEEDAEPVIGDGGDGGGVVLGDVEWGERALSLARELFLCFGDDIALYAFKVSPKGYIYVRLDKLTNRFGCPGIEEIENFNTLYKKRLDEAGEAGEISKNLALEVSSPGAERLLKVPQDLDRFHKMAMWVFYLEENQESKQHQQTADKVFMLESVDSEAEHCIFKLADVKENRAELGKGRTLSRKQKDWRLCLPFKSILRIKLYLDSRT